MAGTRPAKLPRSTSPTVSMTAIVFGLTAATLAISCACAPGRLRLVRSSYSRAVERFVPA